MEERIYRQILKTRAFDRWENEGGRIYPDPTPINSPAHLIHNSIDPPKNERRLKDNSLDPSTADQRSDI